MKQLLKITLLVLSANSLLQAQSSCDATVPLSWTANTAEINKERQTIIRQKVEADIIQSQEAVKHAQEYLNSDFFTEKFFRFSQLDPSSQIPQDQSEENNDQPRWKQFDMAQDRRTFLLQQHAKKDPLVTQKIAILLFLTRHLSSFEPISKTMQDHITADIAHYWNYSELACSKNRLVRVYELPSFYQNIITKRCGNKLTHANKQEEARCRSAAATLQLFHHSMIGQATYQDWMNKYIAQQEYRLQVIGVDMSIEQDPTVQKEAQKRLQAIIDEDRRYYEQEQAQQK